MADGVFNIAKGRVNELHDNVANDAVTAAELVVILLEAAEADATLEDYDDIATLLGAAGNTRATATNYADKALTDTDLSAFASSVDDTGNTRSADIPDQVWSSLGPGNAIVKLLICYDPLGTGVDGNLIPLTHHDFSVTPDGSDLTAQIAAAGYFTAS